RAQIVAHEVELSVMKTYSTSNNPDLQRVEETVKGLKAELAKLERKSGNNPDTLMPTGRMPAVGVDYARKLRDLKFNETLFEIMTKQYEMARIAEAKNPALIQVIDKAVPTRERAGPQRTKKVLVATVISFFFSVVLAFFMEFMEKQKSMSPENRQRIETLKRYMSFKRKKII
ncbi:MAG: hypothetical protein HY758_11370, partial [Nitrospirae bacterium]|nr:hypothetical protein [Nitrospirota bacterium]